MANTISFSSSGEDQEHLPSWNKHTADLQEKVLGVAGGSAPAGVVLDTGVAASAVANDNVVLGGGAAGATAASVTSSDAAAASAAVAGTAMEVIRMEEGCNLVSAAASAWPTRGSGSLRRKNVSVASVESLDSDAGDLDTYIHTRVTYDLCIQGLTYKITTSSRSWMGRNRHHDHQQQERILLNNISARANHSEILAVVGHSGSSKTTLLDTLAGRIDRSSMQGAILVNGKLMDDNFKRLSGYVMQDDMLFPHLTPRETLLFSARLRLAICTPFKEKVYQVDALIHQLGLTKCADTQISRVSGGERRRVSIGVDLIHNPAVLFLDEPTSGLDSTVALQLMQMLSKMAEDRACTVVLTIHQPSFRILETIKNVLVLAEGCAVYHGPTTAMSEYFMALGKSFIPGGPAAVNQMNAVEYALDIIEELRMQPEGLEYLSEYHKQSGSTEDFIRLPPKQDCAWEMKKTVVAMKHHYFATSFMSEVLVLLHRNFINVFRTKELFLTRVAIMILAGLTVGTLFIHAQHNETGIIVRKAVFIFSLATLIFSSTESLSILLIEHQIFIRETSRGVYRTSSYVVAHAFVIPPVLLLLAIIFTSIHYFLVGLVAVPNAFFFLVFVYFLTLYAANAYVAFVSSFVPDVTTGMAVVSAATAYFFLFSGFFIPRTLIPKYWIWLHYLSLFKYPYELCLKNEFHNLPHVNWGTVQTPSGSQSISSQDVLDSMSVGHVHVWLNVVVMIGFVVGYRVLFYLSLCMIRK
ncbi:unnamed protein product [Sphagnum troendelagicum]